ncbi:MAG: hypothetical protein ACFFBP_04310 [Promethearchaeota archaeon]
MPDEFDFHKYKTIEEYGKTIEGTKYLHDLYLKAVNHPVRKEMLKIINNEMKISKKDLVNNLLEKQIINDESAFNYNIEYLIKALCVNKIEENNEIYYKITQMGQIIDYLK